MKNLYPKSKGRIYPSPSSSASASASSASASASYSHILTLLPAAILALVSILSCDDQEVLAYLILHSMKTPFLEEKKKCKKPPNPPRKPLFDCPCFECYTSVWIRWDASPNRELIHQAIEAFEEHLNDGETSKRGRKKDRRSSREEKPADPARRRPASDAVSAGKETAAPPEEEAASGLEPADTAKEAPVEVREAEPAVLRVPARRGWPDVMGIFASRLWGLWNPNE